MKSKTKPSKAVLGERERIKLVLYSLLRKKQRTACTMRDVGYIQGVEDALERIR